MPFEELLDIAPAPQMEQLVRSVASAVEGVIGLEKCHVRKMGFRYYVDLHVVVNGSLTVRDGHNIAHDVEDSLLDKVPKIAEVLVHVEPEEELLAPSLKR
jgi:divalent metal cation (Fe/Co/Zn/Cd) transporter